MVEIRFATLAELDEIVEIEALSVANPWDREAFASELERSWSRIVIALERLGDGISVVGFVNYWIVEDEIHILNVATRPEYRRRGYGRLLIGHVEGLAKGMGARTMLLEVRVTNLAAILLYRSHGFVEVGLRKRYYGDGEDALLMTKELVL